MKKCIAIWLLVIGVILVLFVANKHYNEIKAMDTLKIEVRDGREPEDIAAGRGEPWTLEEISQSVGMSLENIMARNHLKSPQDIFPGQKLAILPYSDFNEVWVSWYEDGSYMANGEPFDPDNVHICAHRWLPFGTKVRITCLETGKKAVLEVQDRGPYVEMEKRHFDLSRGAAEALGIRDVGVARCKVEVLEGG